MAIASMMTDNKIKARNQRMKEDRPQNAAVGVDKIEIDIYQHPPFPKKISIF